ncbi:isochorismate synthase [Actinomycetospora endophytica]|uniref:isochorismate synthase n=1 Tax=Actinomycetospora endophytica TaxID=2291215 RepID=A0ABS8PH62_9PSEU|nr:isochorismate synthase [Actinomycetospora endophytica]MCD2197603.1 isochorismate synthase [Actinomycetospora endophytica]
MSPASGPGLVGTVPDDDTLISDYRPGTTLLAGPCRTVLTEGTRAVLTDPAGDGGLPARVHALLRAQDGPLIVGAVPFEDSERTMLRVPEHVRWAPARTAAPTGAGRGAPMPAPARVRALPKPARYRAMVRDALAAIDGGAIDKVVLARSLAVEYDDDIDPVRVLDALHRGDPTGYLFAVDLEPDADTAGLAPRTLAGASPELLVSRDGDRVTANPLAGTAPRHPDPDTDAQVARTLLVSPKDRHEHALVVDAVARALEPFCSHLDVPAEPELTSTSRLWHLSTHVTGTLADPDDPESSALGLGLALHPTPAVCGAPRAAAHDLISRIEPTARGFYAGLLGWGDLDGNGEWVVALRCGELAGKRARVHAGAGIVAGSSPDAELAETRAKLGTILAALGVDGVDR